VEEVRLGLIGCGRIGERGYVPAIRRARGVVLTAVADPVRERCTRLAPAVPAFVSAAEVLEAGAADALVLATPAAMHLPDATLASAAGVPTLVEKPPAPTAREALELASLEPLPYLGFNRRFEPVLQELRKAALAARSVRLRLLLQRRRSSWPSYESADPVALDLGPHLVDLAFWLSGAEAERITGRVGQNRMSLQIELVGQRGSAEIDCALGRPYRELVEVHGIGSFARGGLRSAFRASESPLVDSLARQLEAFARAVRGGAEADLATAHDGVRVMRALECVTS
jgi:predicted dehydrogenase